MIEISLETLAQFGLAGLFGYFIYALAVKNQENLVRAVESNTQVISELKEVVARLCEKLNS